MRFRILSSALLTTAVALAQEPVSTTITKYSGVFSGPVATGLTTIGLILAGGGIATGMHSHDWSQAYKAVLGGGIMLGAVALVGFLR